MWTSFDQRLFYACYGARHGVGFALMVAATCLGSGWSMLALAPLLARARSRRFATALLLTLLGTAIAVFFAKLLIHRPRPPLALPGVHTLFGDPHDFSFPSGHAAGSFACALFLARVIASNPRIAVGARLAGVGSLLGLASLVALSRVYLGCHFPGDVAAGALLGGVAGAVGARMYLASATGTGDVAGSILGKTTADPPG